MKKGIKALIVIASVIMTAAAAALVGWSAIAGKINEHEGFIYNESASGGKVAIVLDNSEYKDELALMIAKGLGGDIRTDGYGLQDISRVSCTDYDAVIIMAPVYAGKLQKDAAGWIEEVSSCGNVIAFVTNGGKTEITTPVDSVSSATPQLEDTEAEPVPVPDMAEILIDRINAID